MTLTADTITHGNTRHGQSRSVKTGKASPTYRSWVSMLARCSNPKASNYPLYGARGIKIRELGAWLERAQLDAGFAVMDPDPTPPRAPTLRAEIMKARARCAELFNVCEITKCAGRTHEQLGGRDHPKKERPC